MSLKVNGIRVRSLMKGTSALEIFTRTEFMTKKLFFNSTLKTFILDRKDGADGASSVGSTVFIGLPLKTNRGVGTFAVSQLVLYTYVLIDICICICLHISYDQTISFLQRIKLVNGSGLLLLSTESFSLFTSGSQGYKVADELASCCITHI